MNTFLDDRDLEKHLERIGFKREVTPYTALEIVEQMPIGTFIMNGADSYWVVKIPFTYFSEDKIIDKCPHIAAAKAFIAWKKGLERPESFT